jgi:hypothetical protein
VHRLAPLAISILLTTGCGGGGTLSRDSFRKEAESIQSVAAEGALLAHDTADGRTTTPFASVHADDLAESVAKVSEKLQSAEVESELEQDRGRAVRLSSRIEEELTHLHDDPEDRAEARRVADALEEIAKAAEELVS